MEPTPFRIPDDPGTLADDDALGRALGTQIVNPGPDYWTGGCPDMGYDGSRDWMA
jgi:hypothetical protein